MKKKELDTDEELSEEVDDEEVDETDDEIDEADDEDIDEEFKSLIQEVAKVTFKTELAKAQKSLKEVISNELDAYLAEQKELSAKKAGLFNPEVRDKTVGLNTAFRKALLGGLGLVKTNEMTTDGDSEPFAGYAVDSELSAEIRHFITEYGVARREMSVVTLTKGSYSANDLATDVSAYWVSEAGTIKSSKIVLGQDDLTLKKLGVIVTMTRELLQDSEIDLFNFIGTRVAEAFARMEDEAFIIGDGTSDYGSFTGIMNNASVEEVAMDSGDDAFADLTADYLLELQDAVPQEIASTGKYFMHRSIRNLVRALKDTNGNPIYQNPSEAGPAMIWGRPVVEVEVMPSTVDSATDTAFVMYGDLKKACIFGEKGGLVTDRFNSGSVRNQADGADINLITTDREAVRWIERVGYLAILPGAVAVLKTASS